MHPSDSLTALPQAEVNNSYLEDEPGSYSNKDDSFHYESDNRNTSPKTCGEKIRHIRKRLDELIHTQRFQIIVIILVLIDSATVIAILIIDTTVKDEHNHAAHLTTEILHFISICILAIFLVEITVKLFALGLRFFKHKMELFDAFIVITSFVLDVVMLHEAGTAAEIIILFRLWRVTRIVNGMIMSVKKKSEKEKRHLVCRNEELTEQVEQSQMKITAQKKEIKYLREKLESLGVKLDATSPELDNSTQSA
eukprot:gene9968-10991_t